ncbi:hypothetical protein MML61_25570 [Mycobacterium marinum]|uniref:hypothetical protein n=1 Tax=Mycobacterium marinum TaxID=1781 RepID=UPI000E3BD8C9|nr:hypothetical protein [Mycobacterium marinum]RFZ16620.1 hypothetical protein VIMS_01991 [Mycobacterium marinum]WCS18091.1 hypothetical protein MML61_25570 [Mycobacterium marinum]
MTTIDVQPASASSGAPVRETNVYASAALAFGMVGAVVLSVICAIAALADSKNSDQGRGEAIAGLVMSAGCVAVLFALAHWHVV